MIEAARIVVTVVIATIFSHNLYWSIKKALYIMGYYGGGAVTALFLSTSPITLQRADIPRRNYSPLWTEFTNIDNCEQHYDHRNQGLSIYWIPVAYVRYANGAEGRRINKNSSLASG